jgi:hypothetical protein
MGTYFLEMNKWCFGYHIPLGCEEVVFGSVKKWLLKNQPHEVVGFLPLFNRRWKQRLNLQRLVHSMRGLLNRHWERCLG